MDIEEARRVLIETVKDVLEEELDVLPETQLIGVDALVDSMKLVEICLLLEDIADENGFIFDWTSDSAMSKSKSIFRTVDALAAEFALQSGGDA